MLKLLSGAAAVSFASMILVGCASAEKSAPLKPQSFYAQKEQAQAGGGNGAVDEKTPDPTSTTPPPRGTPVASSAVTTAVIPATRPAMATTSQTSPSSGNFIVLGTVVAEANGVPVYADKVLARLEDALAANAKRLEPREFRVAAGDLIRRQIMEQVTDELEFAAAQRNTTAEDQQLASAATTNWRQKEITKAGGSEAITRAKSLEDGMDFDERTRQQYRRHLVQIYYYKHVWPKVQVSANDMRRFYDQNVDQIYSEKSAVRFRAVRINIKPRGKEKAWEIATDVLSKARAGYDFAKLAAMPQYNDNPTWRANEGYRELVETKDASGNTVKEGVWTERGTLVAEDLEKAVFAINPGEVTNVIETPDALYVAKLDEKRTGRVVPFEDIRVQTDIRNRMESEQRLALRRKEQEKLIRERVHREDEKNFELTIDMAMQKYAEWRRPTEAAQLP